MSAVTAKEKAPVFWRLATRSETSVRRPDSAVPSLTPSINLGQSARAERGWGRSSPAARVRQREKVISFLRALRFRV